MRARLILIAAAAAFAGTLALAPPAEAGHADWSFGVGFHVGGLHFRLGVAPPGYGGYPGPFFVTASPLHHRGYGCHGACFRRGAGYYHHASCPLVGFHFGRAGYGPDYFVRHYAPYRGYGPGYAPYRGYGRGHGRHYLPHRYRGYPYRPGWRDRYRSRDGHHYRDRGRGHRGYRDDHRYRHDRGRRDFDHDSDSDSDRGRNYRDDRRRRGDREYARPRGDARRTRPPR